MDFFLLDILRGESRSRSGLVGWAVEAASLADFERLRVDCLVVAGDGLAGDGLAGDGIADAGVAGAVLTGAVSSGTGLSGGGPGNTTLATLPQMVDTPKSVEKGYQITGVTVSNPTSRC